MEALVMKQMACAIAHLATPVPIAKKVFSIVNLIRLLVSMAPVSIMYANAMQAILVLNATKILVLF
jgi:hypothetical protein